MHKLMTQEFDGINPAKVLMHNAMNNVLSLMQVEPLGELSYLLGQFDAYLHVSEIMGILNPDELAVLRARRDAVPDDREASGIDTGI